MKKVSISIAFVICMAMMFSLLLPVCVQAEEIKTIPGLKATWYQAKNEDGEAFGGHGEGLKALIPDGNGGQSLDNKHFDDSKDALFNEDNLIVVGNTTETSFEIKGAGFEHGFDLRLKALDLGLVTGDDDINGLLVKYEGFITGEGKYTFSSGYIDNGCVIFVDGQKVFEYWGAGSWIDNGENIETGSEFTLEKDKLTKFELYYFEEGGGQVLQMKVAKDGGNPIAFSESGLVLSQSEGSANPEQPSVPTPTPNKPNPVNPGTGDATSYVLIALLGASVAGIFLMKKKVTSK